MCGECIVVPLLARVYVFGLTVACVWIDNRPSAVFRRA